MQNPAIYSVSQLNQSVKILLEQNFQQVWLSGEISNFSQPISGHWYLTLKDQNAQVRCAMFRGRNLQVKFKPQNGMQVLVRANISLYEPRGDYQIIIDSMQLAGDGLLQQEFERLKMQLSAEGLFAQQAKQPLPSFCKRVGIITSKSGAALQDILQILQRRDPSLEVIIYPSMVQGKAATAELIQMVEIANLRQECDVLIIGRGGGSLEDLWCFNQESLARAIFASKIPVISAVGHETDITICDFVADIRAPTPSAAAELVSRDQQELLQQLFYQQQRLERAFDYLFSRKQQNLAQLSLRLKNQHPKTRLGFLQQQLHQLHLRLPQVMKMNLARYKQQQEQLNFRLKRRDPLITIQLKQEKVTQLHQRLLRSMQVNLSTSSVTFGNLSQRLIRYSPLPLIDQAKNNLLYQQQRLRFSIQQQLKQRQYQFGALCDKLDNLSPLRVLARGYSITQTQQKQSILSTTQVMVGDKIFTRVNNGQIESQVVALYPEDQASNR
ncbi:exodeoxyribonuclease VII large subunit [Mergibacter septicus]|uniref:Exodeoxyribonuclease 7 large subunit n=1 Tax=Mergibacter septicus TaxID=221402 RepID=A0A8E3MHD2_9PAST|nr:exodeoxyribonuclease VII large subunit [Mergibacter septicus]AWX16240.1 exodeoxyribonuclease VII large subunit [Mergibacter septicus]QDJ15492.1 exodeoxyribonuclease VII large subunit [Mergibacter septicus]UTU48638.1 exodeoxyribonuclease VII large subunit [Mergibacter septicus]WMR95732.1 exodeoxyribonuclease VII large subunit [Mergibacter septicus]